MLCMITRETGKVKGILNMDFSGFSLCHFPFLILLSVGWLLLCLLPLGSWSYHLLLNICLLKSLVFNYALMHELLHDPVKIKLVTCGAFSPDTPRKNHGTNATKVEAEIADCLPQSSTRGLQRSLGWGVVATYVFSV